MAANRLFLMVYLLLEKGTMTAAQLAEHFEVSVRTIYRDIDILSLAGIPIYATQGKGGGISIKENYILNQSLISEEEQNQILMALQAMNVIDTENTEAILSKLSSLFHKRNYNWIEIDFADWNRGSDYNFHSLKEAIFQKKRVEFVYYGIRAKTDKRIAEPLKLVFKSKDWYLYAYCCLQKDYRLFKLTRIKELRITPQSFSRLAPSRIFKEIEPHKEPVTAITLLFDHAMGYRVYDHFDHVTETEDGKFLVEAFLPENEWLYSFLLSFGGRVQVLSPQSIREEMIAHIKCMQKNYRT